MYGRVVKALHSRCNWKLSQVRTLLHALAYICKTGDNSVGRVADCKVYRLHGLSASPRFDPGSSDYII